MLRIVLICCYIASMVGIAGTLKAGYVLAAEPSVTRSHALTLFGEPKYEKGFKHFDYVNPDAPKGGVVKLHHSASFDSLNPFILKGVPAPGLGYIYESLMVKSLDEPQTYYGLIANSVGLADDGSHIIFYIDERAKWHDGKAITAADVVFSFNALKTKGDPYYRLVYSQIAKVTALSDNVVRFDFADSSNRELPFIAASMPILPKHYYAALDRAVEGDKSEQGLDKQIFEESTLKPPLASGPYRISKVDAGRFIVYERVKDYWGADLPARKGLYNFDKIRFDVYRDETVSLEAFKAGQYDFREEYIARNWATAYDIPAVRDGRIVKKMIPHKIPRGMQAFLFNIRKSKFADRRVREAIGLTMDFEWLNKTIFFNAYERNDSFFQNTDFAATGLPEGEELSLLRELSEKYGSDKLNGKLFNNEYSPPKTDGSGNNRRNLLRAQSLLNEAGWVLRDADGNRIHKVTGEKLTIEFMMRQRTFERVIAPMRKGLKRLGIEASFRLVDDAQYQKRLENKDFDIVSIWWNAGVMFPGNEQRQYWHSSQADVAGGKNLSGLKNPLVDEIIDRLEASKNIEELRTNARALDRVLLWEHLVIPHWHISKFRVSYWNKFGIPDKMPTYGLGFDSWWIAEN